MGTNVFLAPCDPENFEETVRSTVELDEHPDRPEELSDLDTVTFWGVRDGDRNEQYFEKMESGDLVLFYQDETYVGTAWIGRTFEDEAEWASREFWNDAPSTLIYTVEKFVPVSVPRLNVNRIFDYGDDYYPQGLMRVAPDRVDRRPAVIKRAIEKFDEEGS